ncbi:homoserine kinase [Roseivirga pacifica]|uniref:homoserine kinase n=1 Tax=Roseivirga pacifica TaxID=1267423 RepID=UPI002095B986|nr:homoserine kinase [Roseivirga pacifica]MCO6361007.1 homoserine kinase [Roseivirga pacifica]MCO6368896.1 homoserine kinase [Roseivirga pacifica]MCO6373039.1 homoserine kinase [Roseivirga pacifica]MCO6373119.1 homoserine kinase [Roseivirga pacifica]MCO6377624.1 homoserine kinase [Roseivirga pacifica]
MESIKVFAPASVSNVGPGFDILGFALEGMGDVLTLTKTDVESFEIEAVGAELPLDPDKNVATVALKSFCKAINYDGGFHLKIEKNFTPGSGLGSSASSAVASVFAASQLLKTGHSKKELIHYALDGEQVASGNRHADNIAPCMLGGFVAVQQTDPYLGFGLSFPANLKALIIFPDIPIKTFEARAILPKALPIGTGIKQAANMAGLVHGLASADFDLIKDSLHDYFAQPYRKTLISGYDEVKRKCLEFGAYGFNLSGSGPTMFAFFKEDAVLDELKTVIAEMYAVIGKEVKFHESKINPRGVEVLKD